MASSIASPLHFDRNLVPEELKKFLPKQTAIDKIGGIFCHICNTTFGNKKDFDSHYTKHISGGGNIVYTCVACMKQFCGYPSFRGHCYLNHVVKDTFQCKLCPKSFAKQSVLNSHITSVHEFKCSQCNEKFASKKDLLMHKVVHIVSKSKCEPPYDCFQCDKVIPSVDICQSHIDDHCQTLYPCPICQKTLPNKLEASKHLTTHFKEKLPDKITTTPTISDDSSIDILGGILCCHCNVLFKNRAEIDNHFSLEHEDHTIIYTCHICGKQYEKYFMFGNHCYFHISKDKYPCEQCEKVFPRLSLLVIHTEAFHSDDASDKPYKCAVCGHTFMNKYRLFEHHRVVHGEQTIKCYEEGCNAVCESPKDLILHQKTHMALNDNWCRQCGLKFFSLASCVKHLDMHKLTQYSCPICNREYREKYVLVKHIPQHFESVVHICKVCGKIYNARHRLLQHAKTHSDQREHKCTYCPKSFFRPHELRQHLNLHTGQRPYECTHCPKTFVNYPNWSKHLGRIHNLSKTEIKELKLAREEKLKNEDPKTDTDSSIVADFCTASASSETSADVYSFAESDDSRPAWGADSIDNIDVFDINTIGDNGALMSVADTVNAAIDRIDSMDDDLDMIKNDELSDIKDISDEFTSTFKPLDDSNDIKAIVEHIDAMSGEMETTTSVSPGEQILPTARDSDVKDVFQFVEMMPVNTAMFGTVSESVGFAPPLGPALPASLFAPDDHLLPHVDPRLTLPPAPASPPASPPAWEPLITKVYTYDDSDTRMYIMNGNIF